MPPKKEPPSCSESDRSLFLRAMGAPQPAKIQPKDAPKEAPVVHRKREIKDDRSADEEGALFLELLSDSFDNHPELLQKRSEPQGSKVSKPKAAPRPTGPDASIDLHACTLEIALQRTEEFLVRCHVKKFRKILVIHGKGSGILKEGVRKYLMHHPHVLTVEDAERQHGGSGAAIATLKR